MSWEEFYGSRYEYEWRLCEHHIVSYDDFMMPHDAVVYKVLCITISKVTGKFVSWSNYNPIGGDTPEEARASFDKIGEAFTKQMLRTFEKDTKMVYEIPTLIKKSK